MTFLFWLACAKPLERPPARLEPYGFHPSLTCSFGRVEAGRAPSAWEPRPCRAKGQWEFADGSLEDASFGQPPRSGPGPRLTNLVLSRPDDRGGDRWSLRVPEEHLPRSPLLRAGEISASWLVFEPRDADGATFHVEKAPEIADEEWQLCRRFLYVFRDGDKVRRDDTACDRSDLNRIALLVPHHGGALYGWTFRQMQTVKGGDNTDLPEVWLDPPSTDLYTYIQVSP